jgi:hypothetical protein
MADSKSAGEILEVVVNDGREELDRASLGLAFSGGNRERVRRHLARKRASNS